MLATALLIVSVQMDFVYLPHPRAITWFCWRKPGKSDQAFENGLQVRSVLFMVSQIFPQECAVDLVQGQHWPHLV